MRRAVVPVSLACLCALLAGCGGAGRRGYDVETVQRAFAGARLPLAARTDGADVVSLRLDRPLVRQRGNTVWLRRWDVSVYVYDGDVTSRALYGCGTARCATSSRRKNVVAFVSARAAARRARRGGARRAR